MDQPYEAVRLILSAQEDYILRWIYKLLSFFSSRKQPSMPDESPQSDRNAYIGQSVVPTETVTISATSRKPQGDWHAEVQEFSIYLVFDVHMIALSRQELLDDRYWPRRAGALTVHQEITNKDDLQAGMYIIFKGTPADYAWEIGRVEIDNGNYYAVNSRNTGILAYKNGRWTCSSAFSTKSASAIKFS